VLDAANSPNGQSYSYSDNTASPLTDYYYRLGDKDMSGNVVWNGPILVTSRGEVITSVSLAPSRPNPCSQGAKIAYALPKAGNVSLNVYDVTGCLVRTLESGVKNAGSHQAVWDLKNNSGLKVSNGIYLYRLTACNQTRTQKLTVIR
jgi:Tol biopolymer transport system component